MNFAKFLRTSFLQKTSGQLLLEFFIHFTVLPSSELTETSLSFFRHVLSRHSNVMNVINLKDLAAAAAWEHPFLGDITWNLAVFC